MKTNNKEEKQLFQIVKDFLSKQEGQIYYFENGPSYDGTYQGAIRIIENKVCGLKLDGRDDLFIMGETVCEPNSDSYIGENEQFIFPVVSTKSFQIYKDEGFYEGFGTGPEPIDWVYNLLKNERAFQDYQKNSVEISEGSQRLGMKFRYSTNLNRCEDRLPGSSLKLWSSPPYVVTGLKLENSFPGKEGGFRHIESITIRNGKKKSFTFSGNQIDGKNRLVFTLKGVAVKYGIETGKAEFIMKKQDLQRTEESSATVKRKIR